MDNTTIEKIYRETFAGCSLFYRDTTLKEELIFQYKKNQIIQERGFTVLSHKAAGLKSNLRYAVASSKAKNVGFINPMSKDYGEVILQLNAFFKVLDIYEVENKVQILLLHISQ